VVCLLVAISMSAKQGQKSPPPAPPKHKTVVTYDASRDPAKDLQDAIAEATRTNKRILLEVGGDWCVYCNIMDATFESHPQLRKVLDTYYVTVKVNYSKENPNEAFLSQYPRIADYPHFFVLNSKGALLYSQPTHKFEHGKTYNAGKIDDFLKKWGQPPRHWLNSVS
jgi:thiol:disulfide interchange protein